MTENCAARPLSSGSLDAADGYDIPLRTLSRARGPRRRRARCDERGGSLAVCAILAIIAIIFDIATIAWSVWMAVNNARAAEELHQVAEALCELAPSDRRTPTTAVRQASGTGACLFGAAKLLQQAAQISVYHLVSGRTIAWPPIPTLSMPIYEAGKRVAGYRSSVHLVLPTAASEKIRDSAGRSCDGATEITTWTADSRGHVRGDLSVEAGRISVKRTGYYHVYSQVSSEHRRCRSADGGKLLQLRWRHSIIRENPSVTSVADELLAVETQKCTGDSRGQQGSNVGSSFRKPSYLGATFLLLRGDTVYVRILCIGDVTIKASETNFGMHMI